MGRRSSLNVDKDVPGVGVAEGEEEDVDGAGFSTESGAMVELDAGDGSVVPELADAAMGCDDPAGRTGSHEGRWRKW